MKNLTLESIKKIASELNITLSYKDENGKRQRFNKSQLIEKIEKFQKDEARNVDAPMYYDIEDVKLNTNSLYGEVSNVESSLESIINNNPVIYVKSELKSGNLTNVKSIISKLQNLINDKSVKGIQKSKYHKALNIINSLSLNFK